MAKILDVVTDQKFIDSVIEKNDVLDTFSEHEYVMVGLTDSYQYLKNTERITQVGKEHILDYIKEREYDAVFLHNLYSLPLELIPLIPQKIKVFWSLWGFDIYGRPKDNPLIKVDLYHEKTLKSIDKQKSLIEKCKNLLKKLLNKSRSDYSICRKAIERIDYISGILPFEYSLIKKELPDIKALPFNYSYSSISALRRSINFEPNIGNAILIGNSADMANNHLDVFDYLENMNLENRSVYCPLSYSGNSLYVDDVIERGVSLFGQNFKPLRNFLESDEYRKIQKECAYCIFFHERQQAMATINGALKLGGKVFLSETNPVFKYYKELGIHIFSIQKDLNQEELSSHLTAQQVRDNALILHNLRNIETETENLKVISALCK